MSTTFYTFQNSYPHNRNGFHFFFFIVWVYTFSMIEVILSCPCKGPVVRHWLLWPRWSRHQEYHHRNVPFNQILLPRLHRFPVERGGRGFLNSGYDEKPGNCVGSSKEKNPGNIDGKLIINQNTNQKYMAVLEGWATALCRAMDQCPLMGGVES